MAEKAWEEELVEKIEKIQRDAIGTLETYFGVSKSATPKMNDAGTIANVKNVMEASLAATEMANKFIALKYNASVISGKDEEGDDEEPKG